MKFKIFTIMTMAMVLITTSILFSLGGISKAKATTTYGSATAADLLIGKTATVDAGQITGTIPDKSGGIHVPALNTVVGVYSGGDLNNNVYLQPPKGYYDGLSWVKSPAPDLISANILGGKNIFGVAGGMPNMATANPNGAGVGRSNALQYWTGGGSAVYLKPQKGYYDGIDTWTKYSEPNLVPGNIVSGKSILGVVGTAVDGAGMKKFASGSVSASYSNQSVTGLPFTPIYILAHATGDTGTISSYWFYCEYFNGHSGSGPSLPQIVSVNSSGFVIMTYNMNMDWIAIGN